MSNVPYSTSYGFHERTCPPVSVQRVSSRRRTVTGPAVSAAAASQIPPAAQPCPGSLPAADTATNRP